jgi:hypothetical protein
MRSIQATEYVARKQGLDISWPQRREIIRTLDALGVTEYQYSDSFDQLLSPADEVPCAGFGYSTLGSWRVMERGGI